MLGTVFENNGKNDNEIADVVLSFFFKTKQKYQEKTYFLNFLLIYLFNVNKCTNKGIFLQEIDADAQNIFSP